MELWTEKGLKFFLIAQLVGVISAFVSLVSILLTLLGVATVVGNNNVDPGALAAGLGVSCVLVCFLCMFAVVILILYIYALIYIYKGREEFGKEHASSVTAGVIMIIGGFLLAFVPIIGLMGGILSAVGWIFLIIKIVQKNHRVLLWSYLGLLIVATIINVSAAVIGLFGAEMLSNGVQLVGTSINLCGLLLLIYVYYSTWNAIKSGIIKPVITTSPVAPGYPGAYTFQQPSNYPPPPNYQTPGTAPPPPPTY